MTDDISAVGDRVATFLLRYRDLPFCGDCVAHELGIARDAARDAIQRLDRSAFAVAVRVCARCARTVMTGRALSGPGPA